MASVKVEYRGGNYEGEVNDKNVPHGEGTLTFKSGDTIKGSWKGGKLNGKVSIKGALYSDRADQYITALKESYGDASEDSKKLHPLEGFSTVTGEFSYEGEMEDDVMCGKGEYKYPNGDSYDGEWFDNLPNGFGMFSYKVSGDRYQGEWKNGRRHGTGTYFFNDGSKYDGTWKNDKKHGWGIETFSSGNRYEGYFVNDKRHGLGYHFVLKTNLSKDKKKKTATLSKKDSKMLSTTASSGNLAANMYQIYEQVYNWNSKESEKQVEIAGAPTPAREPKELKDEEEKVLEQIDIECRDKKLPSDNPFIEGVLHYKPDIWNTIEELFVQQYVDGSKLQQMKDQVANFDLYDELQKNIELLNVNINKLEASLQGSKTEMRRVLEMFASKDELVPSEDADLDFLTLKVEVKISQLKQEQEELNRRRSEIAPMVQQFGNLDAIRSAIQNVETKIFKIDSKLATAKLQAENAGNIGSENSNAKYKEVIQVTVLHFTRLTVIAQQLLKPVKEREFAVTMDVLRKEEELFRDALMLKSEYKQSNIGLPVHVAVVCQRFAKLVSMVANAINN